MSILLLEYNRKDFYNKYRLLVDKVGRKNFILFFDWLEKEYKENGGKPKFIIFNKLLNIFNVESEGGETMNLHYSFKDILKRYDIIPSLIKYENFLIQKSLIQDYIDYRDWELYDNLPISNINDLIGMFDKIQSIRDLVDFSKMINEMYENVMKWKENERNLFLFEENPKAKIYSVNSYYHAFFLGKGTKWCTTSKDQYEKYKHSMDMFVIILKNKKSVYGDKETPYEVKYQLSLLKPDLVTNLDDFIDTYLHYFSEDYIDFEFLDIPIFYIMDLYEPLQNIGVIFKNINQRLLYNESDKDFLIKKFISFLERDENILKKVFDVGNPVEVRDYVKLLIDDFYKNDSEFRILRRAIDDGFKDINAHLPYNTKSFQELIKRIWDDYQSIKEKKENLIFDEYFHIYEKVISSIFMNLKYYISDLNKNFFFRIIECADNKNTEIDDYSMIMEYIENKEIKNRIVECLDLKERYDSLNIDIENMDDYSDISELVSKRINEYITKKYEEITGSVKFLDIEYYLGNVVKGLDLINERLADIQHSLLDPHSVYFDIFKNLLKKKKDLIGEIKLIPSENPAENEIFTILNN